MSNIKGVPGRFEIHAKSVGQFFGRIIKKEGHSDDLAGIVAKKVEACYLELVSCTGHQIELQMPDFVTVEQALELEAALIDPVAKRNSQCTSEIISIAMSHIATLEKELYYSQRAVSDASAMH